MGKRDWSYPPRRRSQSVLGFLLKNGPGKFPSASAFGMQVVWCNRYGQMRERLPGSPDREIKSLAELPGLVAPRKWPR
jgi:hypothetical protein